MIVECFFSVLGSVSEGSAAVHISLALDVSYRDPERFAIPYLGSCSLALSKRQILIAKVLIWTANRLENSFVANQSARAVKISFDRPSRSSIRFSFPSVDSPVASRACRLPMIMNALLCNSCVLRFADLEPLCTEVMAHGCEGSRRTFERGFDGAISRALFEALSDRHGGVDQAASSRANDEDISRQLSEWLDRLSLPYLERHGLVQQRHPL